MPSLVEFEHLWDSLLENYSNSVSYLTHSITGSTFIHASQDFSPIINKWIVDYLTPTTLSIQRQEIAQAIWYTSKLVNKDNALEIGYNDESPKSSATNLDEVFLEIPYKISDIFYKHVYKSLNQQKEYVKANGLSKKAIQMGLDAGPLALQEFNDFIKNFIKRHTLKHVSGQELTHKNVKKRKILVESHNIHHDSDNSDDFENPDSDCALYKIRFKGSQELKPKTLGDLKFS
ncbi:45698_t:CDS:2 [Gigaspora margarita]|uniref:45698_t:CDS:1 n=1 Tax=Gigaspora margarita TaxID=4874 RepID=A0ABN7UW47_GIGMA|nr:45698_t:CDS:2 [Gigaspora margarita]